MKQPRKSPPPSPSVAFNLPREAWDFADPKRLLEAEVEACYFYEFGREFIRKSLRLWEMVVKIDQGEKAPVGSADRKEAAELRRDFREKIGKQRNPLAPVMSARAVVETPWLSLHGQAEPWKLWFMELTEEWVPPEDKHPFAMALKVTPEREFDDYAKAGKFYEGWEGWARAQHLWHEKAKNHELGWLCIDWDYRDNVLKAAFEEFLKRRPEGTGTRDNRGRIKLRPHLKALAAKRLLDSGLTVTDAHKKVALFGDDRSWYSARTKANQLLKTMFPNGG